MNELEIKAKQYADLFYAHEFETEKVLFKKADIKTAYKQGFEDATKWYYHSNGEYPTENEPVCALVYGFDKPMIVRWCKDEKDELCWQDCWDYCLYNADEIRCWKYIIPPVFIPKEKE